MCESVCLRTYRHIARHMMNVCRLHMRDGALHYKLYLLKLTMAVDNIVFRIIKGAF